MKVISFSLWGSNPVYTIGAIRNAEIAKDLFPDWKCIFYCFDCVPTNIIETLASMDNVEVRMISREGDTRGAFNRFLPAAEEGIDYYISRDTDSRLSPREKIAVDAWIESGKDFHIMRDHPYHGTAIMAGMWGIKGGILKDLEQSIDHFKATTEKGQDQSFLTKIIYPLVSREDISCLVHDPFFEKKPFPSECKRGDENNGIWFIGQVFDENDKYNSQSDITILLEKSI